MVKPHLSKEVIEMAVMEITLMPFFPSSDGAARAMLCRYFFDICHNDEQVTWLAKRYVTLFSQWAGLRELRAVASSKFKPRDGIEVYSETYIDGIPSERLEQPRKELPLTREAKQILASVMASTEFPN